MTDYTIRLNRVPEDIPRDVLVEHIAVAIQKIQKGRKALKKVGIQVIDVTQPRKHPFDGPEVNDDLPYKSGGFVGGNASTSMVAGDAAYYLPKARVVELGKDALEVLRNARKDEVIFSGKSQDDDYDTTIKGTIPQAPEEPEIVEVEIDLDGIISEVYRAIGEDFPYLAELFRAKREEHEVRRNREITDPPAEGDWELDTEDRTGEDL